MKNYTNPEIKITENIAEEICNEIKTTSIWEWADNPSLKEDFQ